MAASPATQDNLPELTVSQVSQAIKRTVEDAFGYVRLRGEVSGYRGPHSSGHCYFALKDENAKIDAVIWRGVFSKLRIKPEEGLEIIATGKITTYPGRSSYQIIIERLEPAGAGALMALLEERRRKLAAEGLFDEARKQALPYLPRVVGVVTSPTGAVIRDILHRIADRFPVHVLVWPVRVQGETSGPEVAAAIRGFNALDPGGVLPRPDVLIVARGGGSLEDLWGFNDEAVVRAVSDSAIPVVSAVGHETDWTLIDHAADRRAPTPTAAAEFVLPVRADLVLTLGDLDQRRLRAARRLLVDRGARLQGLARGLPRPDALLAIRRQTLDRASDRLAGGLLALNRAKRERLAVAGARLTPVAFRRRLTSERQRIADLAGRTAGGLRTATRAKRDRFSGQAARLSVSALRQRLEREARALSTLRIRAERSFAGLVSSRRARFDALTKLAASLGHASVLARGYALVRDTDERIIRDTDAARHAGAVSITFADGSVPATVEAGTPPRPTPTRKAGKPKPAGGQGSLF